MFAHKEYFSEFIYFSVCFSLIVQNAWIVSGSPDTVGSGCSIKRKCTVSCMMCFLSIVFIQTSFLMKCFHKCQQFITSQVCLTCEIHFGLDIFIDFFSVKTWSTRYKLFTKGCIYPIACNLTFIYTGILVY